MRWEKRNGEKPVGESVVGGLNCQGARTQILAPKGKVLGKGPSKKMGAKRGQKKGNCRAEG